jgi:hypothetical protein
MLSSTAGSRSLASRPLGTPQERQAIGKGRHQDGAGLARARISVPSGLSDKVNYVPNNGPELFDAAA